MIERKKKICKECGTPQYIFSKGLCRRCWGKSQKQPLSLRQTPYKPLSPVKRYNIPKRTPKRLNQEREYSIICEVIDREAKESGQWKCWFCGGEFRKDYKPDHHHVNGRDGDQLTMKKGIKLAHRSCHKSYHDRPVAKIRWFNDWLERMRYERPDLYEKEKLKLEK